jgi:hypothetical protein
MTPPSRTASCLCGALRITVNAPPVRVTVCHCLDCQRRTGSVFGEQARFPRDAATMSGTSSTFARTGDEGATFVHRFCPTCGSTVWYEAPDDPAFITVPVGGFGDPAFPAPTRSVYGKRKHGWVVLPSPIDASAD